MNIHPLIVHFPVALLSVYALLEILRFKILTKSQAWFLVKATFVILGSLTTFAALLSGDMAEHLLVGNRSIVHVHEFFAQVTTVIFAALAAHYLIGLIHLWYDTALQQSRFKKLWKIKVKADRLIFSNPVVVFLAILGGICLTITGALGGSMVYGAANDPFTNLIYHLLTK